MPSVSPGYTFHPLVFSLNGAYLISECYPCHIPIRLGPTDTREIALLESEVRQRRQGALSGKRSDDGLRDLVIVVEVGIAVDDRVGDARPSGQRHGLLAAGGGGGV